MNQLIIPQWDPNIIERAAEDLRHYARGTLPGGNARNVPSETAINVRPTRLADAWAKRRMAND